MQSLFGKNELINQIDCYSSIENDIDKRAAH